MSLSNDDLKDTKNKKVGTPEASQQTSKKSVILSFEGPDHKEKAAEFVKNFNDHHKKLQEENDKDAYDLFFQEQKFTGSSDMIQKKNQLWNMIKYAAIKYNCTLKQHYDLYFGLVESNTEIEFNTKGEILVSKEAMIKSGFLDKNNANVGLI